MPQTKGITQSPRDISKEKFSESCSIANKILFSTLSFKEEEQESPSHYAYNSVLQTINTSLQEMQA